MPSGWQTTSDLGAIKRKVYKERGRFGALGYRTRGYRWVKGDVVRVKNRLKSLYRSRGVDVAGPSVYAVSKRGEFLGRLPRPAQPLAELLYEEMDALVALKSHAKKAMLAEAKRHREYRMVKSCPHSANKRPGRRKQRTLAVKTTSDSVSSRCVLTACPIEGNPNDISNVKAG